jgi:hypothetical protein
VGHPGFDRCVTIQAGANQIVATAESGKWVWSWEFTDEAARGTIERVDPARAYWFLYEGVVGGRFSPMTSYWGADTGGPRLEVPNISAGEAVRESWRWVYFGEKDSPRVFFVARQPGDEAEGWLAYMGNKRGPLEDAPDGMIVFGFGRAQGAKPLLRRAGMSFAIGFIEAKVTNAAEHRGVDRAIEGLVARLRLIDTKLSVEPR